MRLYRLIIKASIPILSVVFLLSGITLLHAQFWVAGAGCLVPALIGFMYSLRQLEKSPFTAEEMDVLRPWVPTLTVWLIVISLSIVSVIYVADNSKSPEADRVAALAYVSSVMLGLLAVWWRALKAFRWSALIKKLKASRIEFGLLLGVLLLAFSLRTIGIAAHPYPWSGDEASIGTEAVRILNGTVTNFFETGWASQPNWSFLPTVVTQLLLGQNITAVRLTSAVAGTLAVLFVYLAGREMFDPAVGLMAGAFLATLPYHLHFSRIGVSNVVDSLVSSAMFWLLIRGIHKDDARYYYTAGALAGLSIYTYAGTRLVLILALITFLFLIVRQKRFFASHWNHLLAFAGGTVISAAPQAAFFLRHPDLFLGRFRQEGLFLNDWLALQVAENGKSVFEILLNQFTRTTMVFIASPALGNFFNSPEPYLTIFGSILFLLGMGYALAYILEPRYFILITWFWMVILFGGILTLNPPANTRLLMTTPVVALLTALGASKLLEYLQKFNSLSQRMAAPILLALTAVLSYQNISYYMFEYRSQMYFQDPNGEYAMEIALMANGLGDDVQIFVMGEPRVYADFPTFAFIAPNNPRTNVGSANMEAFELPSDQKAAFFAIPENRELIAEISKKYPGGSGGLVFRKPKPQEILFEYYILTR
ncbi:MAG TPA: glycosyltransferase family 39 protein [Anaerolineales bacterium]|nr:glycosyltransferase family 39 protein [Anaerolineales bacterium]